MGSPYIPVDSWIYSAALRLYELGYLPTLYIGLRPYTRVSLAHALELSEPALAADELNRGDTDEAVEIFARLRKELAPELDNRAEGPVAESSYAGVLGVNGPVLNDSFHVGQTFVNDYGRPYQEGLNAIAGSSGYFTKGRFNLYLRGEYQHAPGATGYGDQVVQYLTADDGLSPGPHQIVPQGAIPPTDRFRLINAELSVHILGHQVGFGRTDEWLGPAYGGSMAWSNNAEPIYAFRIDRVEPLYIPLLSRVTGPFRYVFFVGSLKGHDTPNDPWVHLEKVSFKPTPDLEFGFARTVIWGGKGHVPITFGTFLRSFFSPAGVQPDIKFSREDPGARFSTFDFSYRIPWKRYLFSVYGDSFVHDNVFPISNPRRAAWRAGVSTSRLPRLPRVELRAEGAYTDVNDVQSTGGNFLFYEAVQKNGYTNRDFLLGDPLGREDKGGNAWAIWHISPDQDLHLEFRTTKAAKDFIPSGTTQQDIVAGVRLRPTPNLEFKGEAQTELWRAPFIKPGTQHSYSLGVQLTYYPGAPRPNQ